MKNTNENVTKSQKYLFSNSILQGLESKNTIDN